MNTSLKSENRPIIVGLTGGIGSGKTTIAKVFNSLGVPVFNSDKVAKQILNCDEDVVKQVVDEFGALYDQGKLNAGKMANIVFNDSNALEKLNKIVHPKVAMSFVKWISQNNNAPFLIKEAAILIESGAYKQMDKIILVTATEDVRVKRVVDRDNVSEEKVKERMRMQLKDSEKLAHADFVIINDGKELVIPQVLEIYNKIKKP